MVDLVNATRSHPEVALGASPRGALTLYRTSQARAAVRGRDFVLPDDVKALAEPALAHRMILGPGARLRDVRPEELLQRILRDLAVPGCDALEERVTRVRGTL
jgi:MoxR-like ATPase